MTTLNELIAEYDANAYVFADAGNGAGFGEAGQQLDWSEEAAKAYGHIQLYRLLDTHTSLDGVKCHYASAWQDGGNGYSFRVYF